MLTRGVEVWTEVGGILIGRIVDIYQHNGNTWVTCVTVKGVEFVRREQEVRKVSELYERGQNNGPKEVQVS